MTALVTAFGTISISSSVFPFILHIENIQIQLATRGVLQKKVFLEISQHYRKTIAPEALWAIASMHKTQ